MSGWPLSGGLLSIGLMSGGLMIGGLMSGGRWANVLLAIVGLAIIVFCVMLQRAAALLGRCTLFRRRLQCKSQSVVARNSSSRRYARCVVLPLATES